MQTRRRLAEWRSLFAQMMLLARWHLWKDMLHTVFVLVTASRRLMCLYRDCSLSASIVVTRVDERAIGNCSDEAG
jgi:hypothetical protein